MEVPGVTVQERVAGIAMQARLTGTLAVDERTNCLVLLTIVDHGTIEVVDVAWPLGWGVAVQDGVVGLVDARGEVVGRVGDRLAIGGGFVTPQQAGCRSCTGSAGVFEASGELSQLAEGES